MGELAEVNPDVLIVFERSEQPVRLLFLLLLGLCSW